MKIYLAGGLGELRKLCNIGGHSKLEFTSQNLGVWNAYFNKITAEELNKACKSISQEQRREQRSGCEGDIFKGTNILQSFYYCNDFTEKIIIPNCDRFLLDSGAFTFFSSGKQVDWNEYLKKYIDFINRNQIDYFFELDIDVLVGYENVLKLRKALEQGTGKRCIPVWHKSRGFEEYVNMCKEYDYVALGGIVSKEIKRTDYKFFPQLIKIAHENGARIHGLGFTNLEGLRKYHFDSVDSSSWVSGNRFGHIYRFNGKTLVKHDKKQGQRLSDHKAVALNNFMAWKQFAQYAETHL